MLRTVAAFAVLTSVAACAPHPEVGKRIPVTGPPPALLPIDQILQDARVAGQ